MVQQWCGAHERMLVISHHAKGLGSILTQVSTLFAVPLQADTPIAEWALGSHCRSQNKDQETARHMTCLSDPSLLLSHTHLEISEGTESCDFCHTAVNRHSAQDIVGENCSLVITPHN